MSQQSFNRRGFLTSATTAAASAAMLGGCGATGEMKLPRSYQTKRSPWPICLDTATIRPATLLDKIRIASEAGFDAMEPWEGELHEYEQQGGGPEGTGQADYGCGAVRAKRDRIVERHHDVG